MATIFHCVSIHVCLGWLHGYVNGVSYMNILSECDIAIAFLDCRGIKRKMTRSKELDLYGFWIVCVHAFLLYSDSRFEGDR